MYCPGALSDEIRGSNLNSQIWHTPLTHPDVLGFFAQNAYRGAFLKDEFMLVVLHELKLFPQVQKNAICNDSIAGSPVPKFRPSVYEEHGFLLKDDPEDESLPADIHRLFAYENFNRSLLFAREAYDAMLPTLVLAIKLLTMPVALKITCSDLRRSSNTSFRRPFMPIFSTPLCGRSSLTPARGC
ncbi:hypothetical protein BU25DRAFT_220305 [Macroventuria anomochaeta]|uniref:Uncharacterized protein n=1 Tax=Macroventuria anomochaeta TaxID=301207 RepID=A0ACB6SBF1_9PLEO|nr:uncharacterized protein BU25DRAFT_220305 [Macroventuria anomochaeta]KAF2630925.1 hypothetical protein BU25DRAFT_220305 [Macroventuria anomochaeta]